MGTGIKKPDRKKTEKKTKKGSKSKK